MKTFEVYSLYDPTYRGRTLLATVQADRYSADGYTVTFFKDTFFSTKPISTVSVGGAFAVLDTEFSLSPGRPADAPPNEFYGQSLDRILKNHINNESAQAPTKKRSKKSTSDSLLKLDE